MEADAYRGKMPMSFWFFSLLIVYQECIYSHCWNFMWMYWHQELLRCCSENREKKDHYVECRSKGLCITWPTSGTCLLEIARLLFWWIAWGAGDGMWHGHGFLPRRAGILDLVSSWYLIRKIYLVLTRGDIQNIYYLGGTCKQPVPLYSCTAAVHQSRYERNAVSTSHISFTDISHICWHS